jgi:hypothetical protein
MILPGKQANWHSLISEQKQSGQSVAAFCRARGLPEPRFYYWKKRLRDAERPQFVELQLAKVPLSLRHSHSAPGPAIEVRLGKGRSLMVPPDFDASHLRGLLAVLESES